MFAGCLAALGTILVDFNDGVPVGSRTPIILILVVVGALACLYAGHRALPPSWLVAFVSPSSTRASSNRRSRSNSAIHAQQRMLNHVETERLA